MVLGHYFTYFSDPGGVYDESCSATVFWGVMDFSVPSATPTGYLLQLLGSGFELEVLMVQDVSFAG